MSIPSVAVVAAALRDPAALRANVTCVTAERARLAAGLAALGAPASPSVTNFQLVGHGARDRAAAAWSPLFA